MNIELPERFDKRDDGIDAYIIDGQLFVSRTDFEKVMYQLTYEMKGEDTCYYCGRKLNPSNRTLDHLYPKDYGGISIPNNMVPSCKKCNGLKGNLNEEEFREYQRILQETPEQKTHFLMDMQVKHSQIRKNFGIDLPQNWYSLLKEYEVLAPISSVDRYKSSKKYIRISDLYETYRRICKPVVVSQNNIVLDGFMALMFAKNLPFKIEIPFVKLENVIVH